MVQKAPETIVVPAGTDEVACDGGMGALGHPLVYYAFGRGGQTGCWYCGRRFVRAKSKK